MQMTGLRCHFRQVEWCDVIGEPDSIYSPDFTWNCSYRCYRATKNCCYQTLAVLLAPLLAFCLGCQFACLAFQVFITIDRHAPVIIRIKSQSLRVAYLVLRALPAMSTNQLRCRPRHDFDSVGSAVLALVHHLRTVFVTHQNSPPETGRTRRSWLSDCLTTKTADWTVPSLSSLQCTFHCKYPTLRFLFQNLSTLVFKLTVPLLLLSWMPFHR